MSIVKGLATNLISWATEGISSPAVAERYKNHFGSPDRIRTMEGKSRRTPYVLVQYASGQFTPEDTTSFVTRDRESFTILVCVSDFVSDENEEDDVLTLIDQVRAAIQGQRSTGTGFIAEPWNIESAELEFQTDMMTVYSMTTTVVLIREHNEAS